MQDFFFFLRLKQIIDSVYLKQLFPDEIMGKVNGATDVSCVCPHVTSEECLQTDTSPAPADKQLADEWIYFGVFFGVNMQYFLCFQSARPLGRVDS